MSHLFKTLTKRHAPVNGSVVLTALMVVSSLIFGATFHASGEVGRSMTTTVSAHDAAPSTTYTNAVPAFVTPRNRVANSASAAQASDPFAPCSPAAANAIACENSKPGNPDSEWDIVGAGDANIQGYATEISVNRGQTVRFKIATNSNNYRLDIYRIGYYGGLGARLIATAQPSASLPQAQPSCLTQSETGLVDCGNWAESASWAVPSNATSGIYIAKLVREDATPGSSHIVFIVRDDSGGSDILFQTPDTTWQAYNSYGGNSLYVGLPVGRAYKVSYNRPFNQRGTYPVGAAWLFDATYPMARWIEANGYNVSYFTGVDTDRRGAEILEHRVFLSVGHDEYWSGAQRTNVETARGAGVNLAFFSGNLMFWKTRYENSIDGSGTAYRTLVCYKETHANAKIDPQPNVWTGTWRDPRFSPPADGGRPENALTGTIFTVNGPREDDMKVPEALGKYRLWRNTTVATQTPGQAVTIGAGILGYEWDEDLNNGFRPSGLIHLSSNTLNVNTYLLDYGSTFGDGTATHSLALYRHSSGVLVFSAAMIRWSWGLDDHHDLIMASSNPPPDVRMRQATVNLLADMGVQPGTLQPGLVAASPSTDTVSPASTITSPTAGATVAMGNPVNITGTATDTGGGLVAGVNVSVDGGLTWGRATGTTSWSFSWTPTTSGPATIKVIAVDDSANAQNPPAQITVTVGGPAPPACPCSVWGNGATPANPTISDNNAIEVGTKFRADVDGFIAGVRFYKGGTSNGGSHTGHLWNSAGALLGSVTFTNESASGWQQALFQTPVPIVANTTYVVSYFAPQGHYAGDINYFATSGVDNNPLHALSNALAGGNGVYLYTSGGAFPTNTFMSANYWVDVVFTNSGASAPQVLSVIPAQGSTDVPVNATPSAVFSKALDAASLTSSTVQLRDGANALVTGAISYEASTFTVMFTPQQPLQTGQTYTMILKGGAAPRITDTAGTPLASNFTWSFTTASGPPPNTTHSIWAPAAIPANPTTNDVNAIELGLKFRADVDGHITGVRFYKGGTSNGGSHVGHLWNSAGALLGSVTFTNETSDGWQQALFQAPIPVVANTTYVVSYFAPQGHYAGDTNYFATSGVDNSPLHALSNALAGGNGVFIYTSGGAFPTNNFMSANFWVDVVFTSTGASPPQVLSVTPAQGATQVPVNATPSAVFSTALDAASLTSSTVQLRDGANTLVTGAISYEASTFTVTFTPQQPLQAGQTYTMTLKGGAAPRITDTVGTPLASNFTWSFTTASGPPPITTYSIWAPTTTPANPNINDDNAIEVGLKFRADVNGFITGVRFYKGGASNGGSHVGHLWNSAGTLLGTVTFTNETASGWQQALFQTPIAVVANTTYVVSYFAPQGHYAGDINYFASSGVDNSPLHALSNALAGGNGVYLYGSGSGFPTNTFMSANYWVDVVFTTTLP
jgi:hypothetical protein